MLRRIFGPEVEGGRTEVRKKLQSDEHHNFHPLLDIISGGKIKEHEMGGTCSTPEEKRCLEKLSIDGGLIHIYILGKLAVYILFFTASFILLYVCIDFNCKGLSFYSIP